MSSGFFIASIVLFTPFFPAWAIEMKVEGNKQNLSSHHRALLKELKETEFEVDYTEGLVFDPKELNEKLGIVDYRIFSTPYAGIEGASSAPPLVEAEAVYNK